MIAPGAAHPVSPPVTTYPRSAFTWLEYPPQTPQPPPPAGPVVETWARPVSVLRQPRVEQDVDSLRKATPAPRPATQGGGTTASGSSVRGQASWYCKAGSSACHYQYSGGLYAAAGPALRVGDWRGRTVTVCGAGSCVDVKLIDWCACGGGRVIDLYSDAFKRLTPLSAGVLQVTVSW